MHPKNRMKECPSCGKLFKRVASHKCHTPGQQPLPLLPSENKNLQQALKDSLALESMPTLPKTGEGNSVTLAYLKKCKNYHFYALETLNRTIGIIEAMEGR